MASITRALSFPTPCCRHTLAPGAIVRGASYLRPAGSVAETRCCTNAASSYGTLWKAAFSVARPSRPHLMAGAASRRQGPVCMASGAGEVEQVEVEIAAEKMEAGWAYLDVRTKEEYAEGRVPNSVNIPVFNMGPNGMEPNPDFVAQVTEQFQEPGTQILMGCKSGVRSETAIKLLSTLPSPEYEMVNVAGGFMAWARARLPLET